MSLNFDELLDDLAEPSSGPTMADVAREQRMEKLVSALVDFVSKQQPTDLAPLLERLSKQPAPVVNVPAAAPTVHVHHAAPKSWRFEFERNPDGSVRAITATSQGETK